MVKGLGLTNNVRDGRHKAVYQCSCVKIGQSPDRVTSRVDRSVSEMCAETGADVNIIFVGVNMAMGPRQVIAVRNLVVVMV